MAKETGSGLIAYFGYGSLVNRATHRTTIVDAVPARLKGRRRQWRPRPDMPGFPAALLTIFDEDDASIDGLLIIDRADNLPAIDRREARYERVDIRADELEILGSVKDWCPSYVYQAIAKIPEHRDPPRILRSYLDAVLQGFLREHGEEGLRRFLAQTEGFDIEIHDDRSRPIYPRAVELTAREARMFEDLLRESGISRAHPGGQPNLKSKVESDRKMAYRSPATKGRNSNIGD